MKARFIYLTLIFLSSALAFSFIKYDDEPLKALLSNLERFRREYPQEKIHLHLDKPYYTIGDSIWFKAYIVNAEKNQLSGLSKILYVDLISEKDSVKQSLRLPVEAGLAWGDFNLTDSLQEGNYRIRAYTNWMRNFGEEYFFDRTIKIGNALSNTVVSNVTYQFSKIGNSEKVDATINYTDLDGKPLINKEVSYDVQLDFRNIAKGKGLTDTKGDVKITFVNSQPFILKTGKINTSIKLDEKQFAYKTLPVKSTSDAIDVQFFPEGGQLVDSIRSKVAFKALAATGLGADVSGYIVDKNNNRIIEFSSVHAGMGSFLLMPLANNTYTAVVKFADGSEKRVELPQVLPEGYVLSVTNTDAENIYVRVAASRTLLNKGEITLIAQTNHVAHYVSKAKLDQFAAATIPKKRFPTGILQFTLFSTSNQPIAERLIFIQHDDQLKINVKANKQSFSKRDQVKIAVDITDAQTKPVIGSFSVAVTDLNKVPVNENAETTILSNLLLSADLKGYIEQPNYYFTGPGVNKVQQLDNLMLTQGWRRFEWKAIQNAIFPTLAFKPEQNISISGRVLSANGNPEPGSKVTLFATGGDGMLLDTITNAAGRFEFANLAFKDNTKFIVQAQNAKNRKNVEIEIDRLPTQLVTKNKNFADVEINVNSALSAYLKNSRTNFDEMRKYGLLTKSIMLNEVKITEKKAAVKNSSNLNGAGNADAIIKAEQLQTCNNLVQCLQGRVAGLVIQNGIAYLMRNMASSFSGPVPMQLIVDGIYMDPAFLSNINVIDVETIEVLKSGGNTAIYGLRGGGGVLIINTKRGEPNMSYAKYAPGVATYSPKGYHIARQFYSPNYSDNAISTKMADLRTTIYWQPNIITDKDGKLSFEFFTADSPGTYRAVIEGIDSQGNLGRKVYTFTVN